MKKDKGPREDRWDVYREKKKVTYRRRRPFPN